MTDDEVRRLYRRVYMAEYYKHHPKVKQRRPLPKYHRKTGVNGKNYRWKREKSNE